MGDHQDLFKIVLDQIDCFNQTLPADGILAAKSFINYQGLQPGTSPLSQNMGQGQSDRKIDPERFSTGIQFIIPESGLVADLDFKGFLEIFPSDYPCIPAGLEI